MSALIPSFRPNILSITKYVTARAIKSKLERAQKGCIGTNEKVLSDMFIDASICINRKRTNFVLR